MDEEDVEISEREVKVMLRNVKINGSHYKTFDDAVTV